VRRRREPRERVRPRAGCPRGRAARQLRSPKVVDSILTDQPFSVRHASAKEAVAVEVTTIRRGQPASGHNGRSRSGSSSRTPTGAFRWPRVPTSAEPDTQQQRINADTKTPRPPRGGNGTAADARCHAEEDRMVCPDRTAPHALDRERPRTGMKIKPASARWARPHG
jgi:hypothetical protein